MTLTTILNAPFAESIRGLHRSVVSLAHGDRACVDVGIDELRRLLDRAEIGTEVR